MFVVDWCSHCRIWKKFINQMNNEFKLNKRINIIDCSNYAKYGMNDPIIKIFDKYIDGYPVLFIKGSRKDGANSLIECKQWLKIKKFDDLVFPKEDFFETINKKEIFDISCKKIKGRLICN